MPYPDNPGLALVTNGLSGIRFWARDHTEGMHPRPLLHPWLGYLEQDGYVVDRLAINKEDLGLMCLRAPIHSPALTTRRVLTVENVVDYVDFHHEGIRLLAQLRLSDPSFAEAGDEVPTVEWVAWWQARGARIGRRQGDIIEWDDGKVGRIPDFDERWA